MGTRVAFQNGRQGITLFFGDPVKQFLGKNNCQLIMAYRIRKTAQRVGLAVGIGEIWLHIIDGCAVHQVGPRNAQRNSRMGVSEHHEQTNAGKDARIGTEG